MQHYQKKTNIGNEKDLKPEKKYCNGEIKTSFHYNEIPKESSQCIYLSVILINSVYRKEKDCYPQVV